MKVKRLIAMGMLVGASLMGTGCRSTVGTVISVPNQEVVPLEANDVVEVMSRAGFNEKAILQLGPDLRNALAQQGAAEIRLKSRLTAALFAVHSPYVHVSSYSRGSFVYEVKPPQPSEAILTPPVANAQPPAPVPAEKPASTEKSASADKKGGQTAGTPSPAPSPAKTSATATAPAPVTTKVASARPAGKPALKSAAPGKSAATATSSRPPVAEMVSPLPPKPQPQPESPAPAKSAPESAQVPVPQPSGVPGPTFPKIVGMFSDGREASNKRSATVSAASTQSGSVLMAKRVTSPRVESSPRSLRGVVGSCALAAFLVDDWSYYCGLAANTWTATHHPPQKKSRSGRSISG